MDSDKLIMDFGAERYAVDTVAVAGVLEVSEVPHLPGQNGIVSGILSLRGEPVTVVDVRKAFGLEGAEAAGPRKVIVLKDRTRLLGLDADGAELSFLWKEDAGAPPTRDGGRFTTGVLQKGPTAVKIIDWTALFDEAARILSTVDSGV